MTESATGSGGILKRDIKGRVRSPAARRQAVLEQLERSGLSGPELARVAGMPYQTLASWRHRHLPRSLTGTAIGKKSWVFMGDPKSGDRAVVFYTLMGNCHRESINAEAYLTDLFTRLSSETN